MKRIYDFETLAQEIINEMKKIDVVSSFSVHHGVNNRTKKEYILIYADEVSVYIIKGVIGLMLFGFDGGDPYYMGDAEDVDDIMTLFYVER